MYLPEEVHFVGSGGFRSCIGIGFLASVNDLERSVMANGPIGLVGDLQGSILVQLLVVRWLCQPNVRVLPQYTERCR